MLKWMRAVSIKDQELIEAQIQKVENGLVDKPDDEGGFSDIYFIDSYVLKHTSFWDYDELSFICKHTGDKISWILKNDGIIGEVIKHVPGAVQMYAYCDNWVVMECCCGDTLNTLVMKGKPFLTKVQEEKVIRFLEGVLNCGYYPADFKMECVFPLSDGENVKVIDYNAYMSFSEFYNCGYCYNPNNLKHSELAFQIYYSNIKDAVLTDFRNIEESKEGVLK